MPIPPPPVGAGWPGMAGGVPGPRVRPGMEPQIVQVEPGKPPKKRDKGGAPSSMLGWMAGSKPKAAGKKKSKH
ncbi:uncharacterized protein THITE_2169213 [Thermothielavioides terrestris NRRL 8126]|uniref:Uncharacterized protein n=1 Tax=Thermothielavioides terrestris (strain ATCC 38088 / NRRL 8126) TaxID=578455 RepID=G2QRI7_THETT|nr:uncharacterized protein THITE_2169213 [Thermothielavioides terrestris NRRL 8126]AEO62532.1 hypothetical protein THITE_2169213 [Thermothielavioides terrestris NRRL 8126]